MCKFRVSALHCERTCGGGKLVMGMGNTLGRLGLLQRSTNKTCAEEQPKAASETKQSSESAHKKKPPRAGSARTVFCLFQFVAASQSWRDLLAYCTSTRSTDHRHVSPHCRSIILRKEVIQPQVPLRLPCYDLVPIAEFTFGACLSCELARRLRAHPTFVA